MTIIDTLALMPPSVVTGGPIEAVWGNTVVDALTEHEYKINSLLPPGTIWQYAGPTAPPGWAICDGSDHATDDPNYAALFAVIQYTYGGSGTSFKLPDLRGRFPVGVAPGDAAFWGPSAAAGSRDQALLVHSHSMLNHQHYMENHTHGIGIGSEAGHVHTTNFGNVPVSGGYAVEGEPAGWPQNGSGVLFHDVSNIMTKNGAWPSRAPAGFFSKSLHVYLGYPTTASNSGHSHSAWSDGPSVGWVGGPNYPNTGDAGTAGSGANANLPPYMTLNFIIRLGWP